MMHDFPSLISISPFPNSFQHGWWTEATDMPGNVFSTKMLTLHLLKPLNSYQPPQGKWLASENEWSQLRKQSLLTCTLKDLKYLLCKLQKENSISFCYSRMASVVLYFWDRSSRWYSMHLEICQDTSFTFLLQYKLNTKIMKYRLNLQSQLAVFQL